MKKICVILLLFFGIISVNAADINTIKFNGQKYTLLYSAKNIDNNGYINEYYKNAESPDMWSEMVAVHHFPNMFSPLSQAEAFREYLNSINCPSALTVDEKKNEAMIDFIIISGKRLPIILEFNIFKYEKDENCGTKAIQYVKRYCVTSALQVDIVKREFNKLREKMLKKVEKLEIPNLIKDDVLVETKQEQKNENLEVLDANSQKEDAQTEEVQTEAQSIEEKDTSLEQNDKDVSEPEEGKGNTLTEEEAVEKEIIETQENTEKEPEENKEIEPQVDLILE